MTRRADILMVTYRSAAYLGLSLDRLLSTLGDGDRVWLWHNGDDEMTLDLLASYKTDPRVAHFHHSGENVRLHPPMRWIWTTSEAAFVAKVDDDCIVDPDWLSRLASAHAANPEFGIIGSWRFPEEDFLPALAERKIQEYAAGYRVLRNNWVQGSGFLCSRRWIDAVGPIGSTETFTQYCVRLARSGAVNGWLYPFVHEDHMDDPRSPNTLIHDDAALLARLPLSAQANGVRTVEHWVEQLRRSAELVQSASLDVRDYNGVRAKLRRARRRLERLLTGRQRW